jgi:hypothetical protein
MFSTALLLATTMVVGQVESQPSRQLSAYADAVVGEWTGEATLAFDIPGMGTKGQKITGTATTQWTLEKAAIECEWKFGGATGKWIANWDAEKKIIRVCEFVSNGNFAVGTVVRKQDKWTVATEGASGDGKHFTGTAIMTLGDIGATLTWDETDQMLGGERQPDFRHVWKRVSK